MTIDSFPLSADLCNKLLNESESFRKYILNAALMGLNVVPTLTRFAPKNEVVRNTYLHVTAADNKIEAIKLLRKLYELNRQAFHESGIFED